MVNVQKYWVLYWLDVVVIVVQSLSRVQLQPHGLQHAKASLSFTISRSLLKLMSIVSDAIQPSHPSFITSSPLLQSFPTSGSFPVSQHFASGGLSIGASVSVSVIPMNIQGWFPIGLTGLTSLLSKGLSRVFPSTTFQKYQFFSTQPSLSSNSHISKWPLEKPYL